MIERIESPAPAELEALTDLWERSVRATHGFLAPEDIAFFRRMVREEALPGVEELHVIRDEKNGFAAFAGVEAGKLEMLFVEYLIARRGVRRVDVNEQNAQAAGFYARMGFRVVSRSETDPSGRPYPILHLSL